MRRDRPSPLDEVRSALAVFEHTIWDAVPEYLRSLDRTLVRRHGERPAARRGADPLRILDRRRSRRQPVDYSRGDAPRLPGLALDRPDDVHARRRGAGGRALDVGREPGAPRLHRRGVRAVSGAPAQGAARARVDAAGRSRNSSRRGPAAGAALPARRSTAPPADLTRPLQLVFRLPARDRQRADRRRAAGRRAPAAGVLRPHARPARHPAGRAAAHGGGRSDRAARRSAGLRRLARRGADRVSRVGAVRSVRTVPPGTRACPTIPAPPKCCRRSRRSPRSRRSRWGRT